jgi:prevent-host-death family protein
MATTIPAGVFKAKCLKLLDKVAQDREPLIITKRGKVVAHLIAPPAETWVDPFGALRGSGAIMGDIISPLEDEWEANQ